jgi:hypothetical protein
MSGAAWTSEQLRRMAAARRFATSTPRHNPRPAGVIRPGSPTEVVLACLCRRAPVFLTFAQVMHQTQFTKATIDHALRYLKTQGHIEATADDGRNSRYQRYRATEKGIIHAASK